MRNSQNLKTGAIFMIAIIMAASALAAQGNKHQKGMNDAKGEMRIEKLFEKVPSLTDEQKVQIKSIHANSMESTKGLREQIRAGKKELKAVGNSDPVDLSKANYLIEEIGSMKTALQKEEFKTRMEINAVLTPEQRSQLKQQKNERSGERGYDGK